MTADIIIRGNYLRSLNNVFIQIVPLDERSLSKNDKCSIMTDDYIQMGTAECVGVGLHSFLNLHEQINSLCDNTPDYRNFWRRLGYFNDSKMQLVYLRFIRRNADQFRDLITRECKRISLNLEPQPSLFN
mgnify:CR=1 FL=1